MRSSIPTPEISVVEIGPFSVHIYALCIISGVALAIWLGNKRFVAAYPDARGIVSDVAIIAVPAGVLGGRLYHVITTPLALRLAIVITATFVLPTQTCRGS